MKRASLSVAITAILSFVLAPVAWAQESPQASPLANWAGFFIAGDYKAHSGADSEVFDNGRRDVAKAFIDAGMKRENTLQFSVRPQRYAETPEKPLALDPELIITEMAKTANKAKAGCLFFYTSHGSPQGVVMGDLLAEPGAIGRLINETCGTRPTVTIISACFSGVFAPFLAGANRVVMTAARYDRSSFGCGESDVYTFFDTCLLEELPSAGTFDVLADRVKRCVEKRETELGMRPASEPQTRIGIAFENGMKTYALARSYKVKQGDTLAKISQEMYGQEGKADAIYEANRPLFATRTAAPAPGTTLKIPPV